MTRLVLAGRASCPGAPASRPSFRPRPEKELTAKDVRIQALEKGIEAAKELDKKNASARKIMEEQVEKMRQDFKGYQKRRLKEQSKLVASAQRAANMYKDLIESMGEESEGPCDAPIVDFMSGWRMSWPP